MLNCLKTPAQSVFIMLGQKCNFNCRYCAQHAENGLRIELPTEINPDIFEYFEWCQKLRDKNDHPFHLHFYGGEPLLYFNIIKEIVKRTEKLGTTYSFISNGYAITQEMVNFFNSYDSFTETISWDGFMTKYTRFIDVFKIPEKKSLLMQLNKLHLSAVHSAYTSPKQILEDFQKISDEYQKIHGYPVGINIDELYDLGVLDRSLFDIDYEKINAEMEEICNEYIQHIKGKYKIFSTKDEYVSKLIGAVRKYIAENDTYQFMGSCDNGYSVINIDLAGNFYNCHNSSDIIGSIYDSQKYILGNLMKLDNTLENKKKCMNCPVLPICRNGCKLISEHVREESYCKIKKAIYLPIIKCILNFYDK